MIDALISWTLIIDALGGTGEVAAALSQRPSVVSGWRERGIPAAHWAGVTRLAQERGKGEISLGVLAELAARRRSEART